MSPVFSAMLLDQTLLKLTLLKLGLFMPVGFEVQTLFAGKYLIIRPLNYEHFLNIFFLSLHVCLYDQRE